MRDVRIRAKCASSHNRNLQDPTVRWARYLGLPLWRAKLAHSFCSVALNGQTVLIQPFGNGPKKIALQSLFLSIHGNDTAIIRNDINLVHVRLFIESREVTLMLIRHEAQKFSFGGYNNLHSDVKDEMLLRLILLSLSLHCALLNLVPDLVSELHGLEV